jgi:hypothetical protein
MAGLYDRDGHIPHIGLGKRGVQIRIAEHLVEAVDREIILRAFVFQQIHFFENPGDILFDDQVPGFFDDDQVDFQGFGVKLVFVGELKGIFVWFQFQFEGLDEGGVPGNPGRRRDCLLFQGEPPLRRVEESGL